MKFKVKVQSGKGEYYKDIEDLYIEIDNKEVKFADLYDYTKSLEHKVEALEGEYIENNENHKRIESVLTNAVDLLQKKVARLETLLKD